MYCCFFFFNDTATTEIYTLSLHDALPISTSVGMAIAGRWMARQFNRPGFDLFGYDVYALCGDGCMMEGISGEAASLAGQDRKSTRLNSSHSQISYAVFCLKKKKKKIRQAH